MELDLLVATTALETHGEDVISARARQSELGNEAAFTSSMPLEVTNKESTSAASLQLLQQYRDMFHSSVSSFTPPRLRFMSDYPTAADTPPPIDPSDQWGSRLFIIHHQYTEKLLELISAVPSNEDDSVMLARKRLILDIQEYQSSLECIRNYQWRRQEVETIAKEAPNTMSSVPTVVKTDRFHSSLDTVGNMALPLSLGILGASILHSVVMATIRRVTDSLQKFGGHHWIKDEIDSLTSGWPKDIRSALDLLHIDPELRQYICCPTCFSLYGPFPEHQKEDYQNIPMHCAHRATPLSKPCGTHLFGKRGSPNRCFWYQPLDSWIACFLSRAEVMGSLCATTGPISDRMSDIWDGSAFRQFQGPDNNFLFVDWFNPFGNKQGGKHTSFGAIYMQSGSDFGNTDISTWGQWTWQEHFAIAKMWRDAHTDRTRQRIYDTFGLRWSELLRLPYWDPTCFVVMEAMHNFFLGDLQHHCQKVFGMNADAKSAAETHIQPHTPEEQQRELDAGIEAIKKCSLSALTKLRRGYIVALAEANNVLPEVNISNDPLIRLYKADQTIGKTAYAQALIDWHRHRGDPEVRCPRVFPRPIVDLSAAWSSAPSTTILDQSVLSEVWKDMARTTLLSWVARAPHNLGSPGHGKLKADQWRTACLINLTIMLCRLWGSDGASERDAVLLRNYLSLVTAVRWATTHSTSDQHAEIVEKHLIYYTRSTLQIFGPRALVYNNHASLHVPECLRTFGPTHGWWAFPFERYNGILQRFKTNTRIGEMEHTMMKAFCRGSNLRAFLGKNPSDSFQGLHEIFSQFFGIPIPSLNVTHGNDGPNITENANRLPMLPDEMYKGLLNCLNEGIAPGHCYMSYHEDPWPNTCVVQPYVQEKASVKIQGVTFTCSAKHLGNSRILFCLAGESFQRAGEIKHIFVHQRHGTSSKVVTEFFYGMRQFRELPHELAMHDPYRQFPLLSM
ncbi:hypothetical protein PISMIDRAFT_14501 [Pisolithus microcarpus 441]|uniref:Uncharacterized protein n=1 Tax=Pisolithus microcarpus 441 TaxID=765257 RepID=A0A0C9YND4_9AGAM|nr:hypothetical protein PISMIDRAFT_14501 [Pisolithus microcarpus 441]